MHRRRSRKEGRGGGAIPLTLSPLLAAPFSFAGGASAAPPPMHQALVALADLAIRSATLLPVRMDLMEVLRLLHKDGRAVREEVHVTALPASICTTPTHYRSSATVRLVVIP